MKIFMISLVSLVFTGCAALESPNRYTEGNTFYSSKAPPIRIEVSQEYKYFGEFDSDYEATMTNSPSVKAEVDRVIYNYGVVDSNNHLRKLFQINMQHIYGNRWFNDNLINTTTSLKHGIITLHNTNFQYEILPRTSVGNFSSQFLLDKGIFSSSCVLLVSAGRRYGNKNNSKMYLNYMEDISNFEDFNVESCADWNDIRLFNEKQKAFLKGFEKSIENTIKIADYEINSQT